LKVNEITKGNSFNVIDVKEKRNFTSKNDFIKELEKSSTENISSQLKNLLDEIELQGKKIGDNFQLGEVLKYKKLVKEFLNLAVNNSHKLFKDNFLDRRGNHRIMNIVKKVDEELDKLLEDVLNDEKDNIKILNRMDIIKGMLIDILI